MAKRTAATKSAGAALADKVLASAGVDTSKGKGRDLLGGTRRGPASNLMKQLEAERQSGGGGFSGNGKLDAGAENADADKFLAGQGLDVEGEPGPAGGLDDILGSGNEPRSLDDDQNAEPIIRSGRQPESTEHVTSEPPTRRQVRQPEVDEIDDEPEFDERDETDPANWPDWMKREGTALGLRPERYRTARDFADAVVEAAEARAAAIQRPQEDAQRGQQQQQTKPGKFDPYNGKRDEYTEETQAIVDAQTAHYAQYDERLERMEQLLQRQQQVEQQRRFSDWDKNFQQLNNDYDGAFGILPSTRMNANSPEAMLRKRVMKMVVAMADDPEDQSHYTLQNFQTAAAVIMGEPPTPARGNGTGDLNGRRQPSYDRRLQNRQNSMVAQPSGRRQAVTPPATQGVSDIKKWLAGEKISQ